MDSNFCCKAPIFRFKWLQKCSIGFKSGEYGGWYTRLQPAPSIASRTFGDLWILALSMITIWFFFKFGTSISFTHFRNNSKLHVPWYPSGAKISFPHLPATILHLSNFRPGTASYTCSPFGARQYSRCKCLSMPDSSTKTSLFLFCLFTNSINFSRFFGSASR